MRKFYLLFFTMIFSFSLYGESVRILHSGVTSGKIEENLMIESNAVNSHLINYLIIHYKKANVKNWKQIEMVPQNGKYVGVIPKEEVFLAKGIGIVYYIEVIDITGASKKGFASIDEPQYVEIKEVKKKENIFKNTDNTKKKDDIFDDLSIFIEDDFSAKKVTLASGKEESIIASPFAVTVLTRKEIEISGATSIPEVFRLVPGMIVKEQTAGNYDVHIRGFNNVPPNSFSTFSSNSLTLLMINNRVVYDYQLGGIFWDALPIDINDIERIEIIRGPASAMYGPSAASGVINIITRTVSSKKRYIGWVNLSKGGRLDTDSELHGSTSIQGIAGYYQDIAGERKLGMVVSGNFQDKGRTQSKIWSWNQDPENPGKGEYVEPEDVRSINSNYKGLPKKQFVDVQYPYANTGVLRHGFNANVTYDLNKKISLQVDAGAQDSVALKPWQETLDSFLLTHESKTQYINSKLRLFDVETRVSYTWGRQPIRGQLAVSNDIGVFNSSVTYGKKFLDMFDMKGIVSYNKISYGSIGYGGGVYKTVNFENIGLSLRSETSLLDNSLKFIAAGRLDAFAHLNKRYLTFQLAGVYNYNDKMVFRTVFSRANRNPFLGPTFYQVRNLDDKNPAVYRGNKDLKLVTVDMIEFGTRFNFNKMIDFDLELFYTTAKDFSAFVPTGDVIVIEGISRFDVQWSQLNFTSKQFGGTLSTSFVLDKFRTKLFITLQKTEIENYNPNWFNDQVGHLNDKGETIEHLDTPKFFGGGYVNFGPFHKANINISTYYYGESIYHHLYDEVKVDGKIIFNLKLSYDVTNRSRFYFNARNVLNDKTREFGYADYASGLYIAGFNAKF